MRIAITGRIGSGKSEVLSELKRLGAFTVSADRVNAQLFEDKVYLDKLKVAFPEAFARGCFDKSELKRSVFSSDEKRKLLNSIAHPEIFRIIKEQIEDKPLAFVEVPLLTSEWAEYFDGVWLVESDTDARRARVKLRDGRSDGEIDAIFNAQSDLDGVHYENVSVIVNDSSHADLVEKVRKLYQKTV